MIHNQSIFRVKDHAVSGESFELHENSQYGYLETTPQPNDDVLGDYYNSVDYISHTDSSRNFFEKGRKGYQSNRLDEICSNMAIFGVFKQFSSTDHQKIRIYSHQHQHLYRLVIAET